MRIPAYSPGFSSVWLCRPSSPRAAWRCGLPLLTFHRLNDFHGFDAYARDPHEEVNDLLLVIGKPVGVELGSNG